MSKINSVKAFKKKIVFLYYIFLLHYNKSYAKHRIFTKIPYKKNHDQICTFRCSILCCFLSVGVNSPIVFSIMTFEQICNPYFEAQLKTDLNFYFLLKWRTWQHKRSNTSKVTLLDVLYMRRVFNTFLLEGTYNKQKSGVKAHFFRHQYIDTRSCCNYV